uniref:Uncharacterized protein n=1 Tax=Rhizophora mucronata TaxID=61149 RepID=A0A2P2N792_RHIMU
MVIKTFCETFRITRDMLEFGNKTSDSRALWPASESLDFRPVVHCPVFWVLYWKKLALFLEGVFQSIRKCTTYMEFKFWVLMFSGRGTAFCNKHIFIYPFCFGIDIFSKMVWL